MHRTLTYIILAIGSIVAAAQDRVREEQEVLRPVTSAYMIEIGSAHTADTYLSPLKYEGVGFSFMYERLQAMKFNPERFIMGLKIRGGLESTQNPARNANIYGIGLNASWEMMWRFCPIENLTLAFGGSPEINIGALYSTRNGNNPVAAKASALLSATAMAAYRINLFKKPLIFRWQPTMPITGCFFSQDYGELYYEIYLGNDRGLVHAAWPGNYFSLDNLVTADWRLGATSLRLGYHSSLTTTRICGITTRFINHQAVVGLSGEWLSLSPRRKSLSRDARLISAFY